MISRAVKEGINIYIILSYAAGFALGLYVGMLISQLISKDILSINIFSRFHSEEIENFLREKSFGVTCYYGSGKDGNIKVLNIICKRNNFTELKSFVKK
ncbi:MAG: hypothetical protein ISS14_04960 [Actinobacteria bacterium]|nr:hypothetical protein [Actinomycetota bacterium]MBL7124221.1 hypothetical protein [Actinomycetota bacterium]